MNVISKKSSKRLVKGATYKVAQINNNNTTGSNYFRPTVRIYLNDSSIQVFPLDCFNPTTGSTFPQSNWICPEYREIMDERQQTRIDHTLKAGDYVVPLYDHLKTLVKGRKYKVNEVRLHEHKSALGVTTWTDIKIQLEGSTRFYASFNFRRCSISESREIGLGELFDEKVNTETVNKYKRKFDYYSDEEKTQILITSLIESANDRFRNKMDIIDWCIHKTSKVYKLNRGDFDPIKDLTLSQILDYLK